MPTSLSGLLLCLGAFLLGAIPFGFMAGKLRGVDLRAEGSGNIGATNTLRVLGIGPGVAVLLLDTLKGFAPIWAARQGFFLSPWWVVGAGLAAVLGHTFSPFLGFKGGKGVATSLGVLIGLSPLVALISTLVFAVVVAVSRYVSLGSILAAITQAALLWTLAPTPLAFRAFGLLVAGFVVFKHSANIKRLLRGEENRLGRKKNAQK